MGLAVLALMVMQKEGVMARKRRRKIKAGKAMDPELRAKKRRMQREIDRLERPRRESRGNRALDAANGVANGLVQAFGVLIAIGIGLLLILFLLGGITFFASH